jgi:hypothetical protein
MTEDRQERIRRRAYFIWQREGRPEGADLRHWVQATAEIDREDGQRDQPAATLGEAEMATVSSRPLRDTPN